MSSKQKQVGRQDMPPASTRVVVMKRLPLHVGQVRWCYTWPVSNRKDRVHVCNVSIVQVTCDQSAYRILRC